MGLGFDITKILVKFARSGKGVYTAIDSGDARDWVSFGSPTAALGADAVGKIMKEKASDASKEAFKKLAPIIDYTLVALSLAEFLLLGLGGPEKGKGVKEAGTKYKYADDDLGFSLPEEWSGPAADDYAKKVADQRAWVKEMQAYDKKLVEILTTDAEQLTNLRLQFTVTQDFLSFCIPIAMALLLVPPTPNEVMSTKFQIMVCWYAVAALGVHMGIMVNNSHTNAVAMETVISNYISLAAKAVVKDAPSPTPGMSAATESTVSSFEAISESLSEFAMPDFATLVNSPEARESMPPQQQALMSILTGDAAGAGAAGEQSGLTLPSLSQVSKASGQVAQMSGQVSQLMNQMMGQIQQLASMGQQAKAAAPPAKLADEVTPDENAPEDEREPVELVAAQAPVGAAGAEGAERAPVDATVGAAPAHEPSPVQRNV